MKVALATVGILVTLGLVLFLLSLAWAAAQDRKAHRALKREKHRFESLPMGDKLEEYARKQGWYK